MNGSRYRENTQEPPAGGTEVEIRHDLWVVLDEIRRTEGPILFLGGIYIITGYVLQLFLFGRLPELWPIPDWVLGAFPASIMSLILVGGIAKTLNLPIFGKGRWRADGSLLAVARVFGSVLTLFTLIHFLYVFSVFKTTIPRLQPFSWDYAFMVVDRVIHLGSHPWLLIHPLVGKPGITQAIDLLYTIWFYLLFLTLLWMALSSRVRLRIQFFISFILIWIMLGTIGAMLFSSAGPCFFHEVTGTPGPYGPLMDYLKSSGYGHSMPLLAVHNQSLVWGWYSQGVEPAFGHGISAMPSIHVATAVLLTLAGWQLHRLVGGVLAVYALAVQVGSVHLGWHYAIDGYIAALATLAIWKGVGWYLNLDRKDLAER